MALSLENTYVINLEIRLLQVLGSLRSCPDHGNGYDDDDDDDDSALQSLWSTPSRLLCQGYRRRRVLLEGAFGRFQIKDLVGQ